MTTLEVIQSYPGLWVGIIFILGLLIGSFLNVVIYRLPVMMERSWKSECRLILEIDTEEASETESKFNLAFPTSHCPHCKAEVKPWQNIPVFSFLLLKGRCHACQQPISIRYPAIELVTAVISGVVAWHFGPTPSMWLALLLSWALIALTMIDFDHKLLPDQITLPILWLGLIANSFNMFCTLPDAVWGAVAGYLTLWSVYWLFKLLTGKEGMGFGDFKLLAALGAWFGWQALPMIILLSSLVGAVLGTLFLIFSRQGRNTAIPFGPYLAGAGWISLIWGQDLLDAYLNFVGLA